jgi:hypothetical protein
MRLFYLITLSLLAAVTGVKLADWSATEAVPQADSASQADVPPSRHRPVPADDLGQLAAMTMPELQQWNASNHHRWMTSSETVSVVFARWAELDAESALAAAAQVESPTLRSLARLCVVRNAPSEQRRIEWLRFAEEIADEARSEYVTELVQGLDESGFEAARALADTLPATSRLDVITALAVESISWDSAAAAEVIQDLRRLGGSAEQVNRLLMLWREHEPARAAAWEAAALTPYPHHATTTQTIAQPTTP